MSDKARIVVMTGPGKGKTTAALGMLLRAVGHGRRALLARFAKATHSGELDVLSGLPGVGILWSERGMTPDPGHPDYPAHVTAARKLFDRIVEASPGYDMVVMDEICGMMARDMVPEAEVLAFLATLRPDQTAILTGRGAGLGLIAAADTVSEILCLKHGYLRGIRAQAGVEF